MNKKEYSEYLNHPLWLAKREEVFQRYGRECSQCSSQSDLAVHHKTYAEGKLPWEYPLENFLVLCEKCHKEAHSFKYTPNKCNQCGKIVSEKFELCLSCHNSIQKKYEELKIEKMEELVKKTQLSQENTQNEELRHYPQNKRKVRIAIGLAAIVLAILFLTAYINQDLSSPPPKSSVESPEVLKSHALAFENIGNIRNHIGDSVLLNVYINQVSYAKNGNIYMNIGGRHPNQKLALVVFDQDKRKFGNLKVYENKRIIVQGQISEYRGRPQIVLNSPNQIVR
jgi:DNA-directed RNA polymerase subunit N (RpoN/RPB10)